MKVRIVKQALLFATFGLVGELAIVFLIGLGSRPDLLPHVALSVLGLYLGAGVFGKLAADYVCRKSEIPQTELIGVGVAWISLMVQAFFGSALEFIRNADRSYAFEAYLFRPIFWVMFLGTIPAIVFGLVYAKRIRKILTAL
jgi:hypothetical protein